MAPHGQNPPDESVETDRNPCIQNKACFLAVFRYSRAIGAAVAPASRIRERKEITMSCRPVACIVAACAAPALAQLGSLTPPAGPVSDTGPNLREIEPRTIVNQSNTPGDASNGFIIGSPGHYVLDGDKPVPTGLTGILITSSDVVLDLNGFTVSTTGLAFSGEGIDFNNNELSNVTIRNGTLRGFAFGGVSAPDLSTVENIKVIDCGLNGISAGDGSRVRGCLVSGNLGPGSIHGIIVGNDSTVDSCTALGSDESGITGGARCRIFGNTVTGADAEGITCGLRSRVTDNSVSDSGTSGIVAGVACQINGNNVSLASEHGILADSGCTISRNLVTDATMFGIVANGDCAVDMNAINNCTAGAINLPSDFNKVTRNDVSLSGNPLAPGTINAYIQGPDLDESFIGPANDMMSPWTNIVD